MSKPSLMHVFKSVIAAGIGVQSDKNREIDFEQGSPGVYLVVGLVVVALFIGALLAIASMVIS